ncbi:MAG: hypothetical protein KDJ48_04310 [Nitratireductor sp.]|nr:hypothetical protein [Nitratireductor sp.]
MRPIVIVLVAISFLFAPFHGLAHAESKRLKRAIGIGLATGIGAAILHDLSRKDRTRGQRQHLAGSVAPAGKWQALAPLNGDGATVCNTDGDAYACFALRCGKGRGIEFAFLFNRGDYGDNPRATITTDKGYTETLQFSAVDRTHELVSPFETNTHAGLTAALQQGNFFTFDIGFNHVFSLKGSGREIERTLELCESEGFDPGEPVVVQQGTQGLDGTGGVRQAKAEDPRDLSWRRDDTEESYVARIRAAAVSYGGPCDEEQAVFERLQRDIKVAIDRTEVRAGDFVTVNWSGNTLDQLLPAYLVVATDAPVRFKGEGFYALMPNAIGPFGIETFKDRTRAIVPLFGLHSSKSGTFQVRQLIAGTSNIEWSVVGFARQCKDVHAGAPTAKAVSVRTALPEIVTETSDELEIVRVLDHPESTVRILIGEKHFHIVEKTTGALIATHEGFDPAFSFTGRFVVAEKINSFTNENSEFVVYDNIDGRKIYSVLANTLSWIKKDLFLVGSSLIDGGLSATPTLPLVEGGRIILYMGRRVFTEISRMVIILRYWNMRNSRSYLTLKAEYFETHLKLGVQLPTEP